MPVKRLFALLLLGLCCMMPGFASASTITCSVIKKAFGKTSSVNVELGSKITVDAECSDGRTAHIYGKGWAEYVEERDGFFISCPFEEDSRGVYRGIDGKVAGICGV